MIGKKVTHYRVLEKIGEGGMGEVYLAEDEKLLRKVALKFLPAELTRDEARRQRFVQEARAAAAIEHPYIAVVYDVDEFEGQTFISMEYVRGKTLRDSIPDDGLGVRRTLELAIQVGEGMAKAHEHGVVHRDLKPENILISQDGYPKVIDFGLAKLLEPLTDLDEVSAAPTQARHETREGMVLGTVAYMSPEQARGERVDSRSDVFSFGAVVYEMLTGTSPFRRPTAVESLSAVLKDTPPPPNEKGIETPKELERVLRKALAKDKAERYQTMRDLALDLREVRDEMASGAHVTAETAKRSWWPKAALATVIALAIGGSFALFEREPPAPGIGVSGRPAVAVLYFENNSGDEQVRWLSKGLPSMLLTDLAQTPGLDVVSSQRIHEILEQIGQGNAETIDKGIASEVARRSGAGAIVVGSIFKSGEEIRIDVQVEDVASGRVLSAQSVRGTDVFPLVDDLTARIRTGLRLTGAPPTPPLAEVTTESLEAYRYYTEALDARRNLRYNDARELLSRTVAIDPSFSMAHYQLYRIASRLRQLELAEEHMSKVLENLDRLPERDRLLVLARNARDRENDPEKGAEILETLIERYPDEEDAYVDLTGVLVQLGQLDDAFAIAERGVRELPQSGGMHNNYGYELMRRERYRDALREFEAYAHLRPNEPNPHDSMGEVHLLLGEPEKALQSYGLALERDPDFVNSYLGRAWAYAMMGRYDEAFEQTTLARSGLARIDYPLLYSHITESVLLSRVGRYAEASEALRAGRELAAELEDEGTVVVFRVLEAGLLLERGDLDGVLRETELAANRLPMVENTALREAQTIVIGATTGIALARSNRLEQAKARLARMGDIRELNAAPPTWFSNALAGEIALKEGRLEEAEGSYASGLPAKKAYFNVGAMSPTAVVQIAPFRDGLARVRRARGDWRGAIEVYRSLNTPGPDNPWTSCLEPRFVLETARLLREHGEAEEARTEYERFLALWKDADPGLPELREARQYLSGAPEPR